MDIKQKLKEWQQIRTDAITEMFDNPDKHGIYPTSKFFKKIDNAFEKALKEAYKKGYKQGEFDAEPEDCL